MDASFLAFLRVLPSPKNDSVDVVASLVSEMVNRSRNVGLWLGPCESTRANSIG